MAISKRTWTTKKGEKRSAWEASYTDKTGKRRRKQFDRKKEAESWMIKVQSELAAGLHTPESQSISVKEAAQIWLQACARGRDGRDAVERHTLRSYESHVRLHINPLLGERLLSSLTAPEVSAFRDRLLDAVSRSMAKKVVSSLKAILTEAQKRGLVSQNVAQTVSVSTASRHKKRVEIPSKAEVREALHMAQELRDDHQSHISKAWRRYYPFLQMAVSTGMRASELRGLYWSHIDMGKGVVTICQRADEDGIIGPVKSGAGRRAIRISPALVKVLREWKLNCPPGDLVFPNFQGKVENHANMRNRCWYSLSKRCGLLKPVEGKQGQRMVAKYNFHALRHFHASMLIASGATPKEVQVEMGHSSIQVTFDVYGHLFPENDAERTARAAAMDAEIFA
ncbi:site-specific integrase [Sneathiella chinensis]|nr:site-specific integrase [Sneathiella chinensis]